jgi:hypothetical protein
METKDELTSDNTPKKQCHICQDISIPDIMTAYEHVGESLSELYHCCSKENDKS